ncbi:NUDIX hydrolase [Pedobacter sp.]|uniref:NUDIX hydrolase n=1 Tax=Pedobacter sp. TaxID=1411316 RepID=UPI003D7F3230
MTGYTEKNRMLIAVDCIIFGFDGETVKILLIKRDIEPEKDKWSLMGGFVQAGESIDEAAQNILTSLTGLNGVYLEQLRVFGNPDRDPVERTVSVAYFALIDINKYKKQLNHRFHAEWFPIKEKPPLIFDHEEMVETAKTYVRYKAAHHPLLFELLPKKFTIPQVQSLYEGIFNIQLDNRNFIRKLTAANLLIKLDEKDKLNSKKGAFYFKLDKKRYKTNFPNLLSFIPKGSK